MFDAVAKRYDVTNDVLSLGQDRRWRTHVVDAVAPWLSVTFTVTWRVALASKSGDLLMRRLEPAILNVQSAID